MLFLVGLLLVVTITGVTGFFVAQEFGFVAANRSLLRQQAEQGDRGAARALKVTGRLSFVLSGAQLGITVTSLVVGYVAQPLLGQQLARILGRTGVPASVSMPLSLVSALVIATVVQMVLGELAPKNLAIARPETLAKALAPATLVYLKVFGPVIQLFDAAAAGLLRRLGIEPVEELPEGATAEDLEQIIAGARDDGHLDAQVSDLLDRGLDFRRLTVAAAMVPRIDVHTIRADEPASRVVELLDTGRSRFPVQAADDVDDIIGVVGIVDLLQVPPAERPATAVSTLAVPPLVVPSSLRLPVVLDQLRAGHRQLACVVDEFGGFAGVITLEDIAEELVGPIRDEDDLPEPAPVREADGSWVVPARWRIDEVSDTTGVSLPPDPDYDTVSGLVMSRLARMPQVGDEVEVDLPSRELAGDEPMRTRVTMTVLEVAKHVPGLVRITVHEVRDHADVGQGDHR